MLSYLEDDFTTIDLVSGFLYDVRKITVTIKTAATSHQQNAKNNTHSIMILLR